MTLANSTFNFRQTSFWHTKGHRILYYTQDKDLYIDTHIYIYIIYIRIYIYLYTYINIEFMWIHDIHISLVLGAISCPKYPIVMNSTKAALTASDSVAQVLATSGAHQNLPSISGIFSYNS